MGNIDVAYRLMRAANLPPCTCLSSQQSLSFRFLTLLLTNTYLTWTLSIHKDLLVNRLTRARSGDVLESIMPDSAWWILRCEPFDKFVEAARIMLLEMAVNPGPKWKDELLGAEN